MNNNQFRRLVLETPSEPNGDSSGSSNAPNATSSFGGKNSSFMPMTPRTVKGGSNVDFARQVRERNAAFQPAKKFKSSAPKGVKYAAGYTDRAKARAEAEDGGDDKAQRIQALEEQMKLGQISAETFEALRDQITGGDVSSTHLVKGLDRKLLERVRRGEDVLGTSEATGRDEAPDVDEELDKLGDKDVEAVTKEKTQKKGSMAAPPPVAGVKRSRDEIMAELKAQRKAAAEAKASAQLDNRWRKVGQKEQSRIEIDHKGREVLITVDEDGMVKKKVRKIPVSVNQDDAALPTSTLDTSKPVLGADTVIPERERTPTPPVDLDDDIFEGVGTEYNPLGDDEDEESSDDSENDEAKSHQSKQQKSRQTKPVTESGTPALENGNVKDKSVPASRNYFKDDPSAEAEPERDRLAGMQDLLKKAARMDQRNADENGVANDGDEEHQAKLKKRAAMLAQQDRDLDDMDMGFGGSRYDDGEEEGEEKIRLSEWKGSTADDGGRARGDGGKKKRKPKKRKGDVNNAADIMRVIEGRNAASKG